MDILKLFVGLAAIVVLTAALGFVNLSEYGLGGVQEALSPVLSDIQAAIDYVSTDLAKDLEDLLAKVTKK